MKRCLTEIEGPVLFTEDTVGDWYGFEEEVAEELNECLISEMEIYGVFFLDGSWFKEEDMNNEDFPEFPVSLNDVRSNPHHYIKHTLLSQISFAREQSASLSFREFSEKNKARHLDRDDKSRSWDLKDWVLAVAGEAGELSNVLKKWSRGDFDIKEMRKRLGHEAADVYTYLDHLCREAGVDFENALKEKFNIVSKRIGSSHFFEEGDE